MNKYFLITSALLLASPLALAQTAPPPTAPPSTPSNPPDMPVTPGQPEVEQHQPDADSQSGSVREDRNSLGANANSKPQSAKGRLRSGSQPNDFAMWDVNGDGKITKDEIKGDAKMSADFKAADKDGNGNLSKAEYERAFDARAPGSEPNPPKAPAK